MRTPLDECSHSICGLVKIDFDMGGCARILSDPGQRAPSFGCYSFRVEPLRSRIVEPYIALLIIVGVPVAYIALKIRNNQKAAERARMLEIVSAVSEVQEQLEEVSSLKGTTARVNRCKAALNKLYEVRQIEGYKEVVTNYDKVHERLESMIKVFPAIDKVERAYKHRFEGKDRLELNALTDALHEIQTGRVSNEDFVKAEIFPEGANGEIVQIEGIKSRLQELGWDNSKDGSTI